MRPMAIQSLLTLDSAGFFEAWEGEAHGRQRRSKELVKDLEDATTTAAREADHGARRDDRREDLAKKLRDQVAALVGRRDHGAA